MSSGSERGQSSFDAAVGRWMPLMLGAIFVLVIRAFSIGVYFWPGKITYRTWFSTRTIATSEFRSCEIHEWSSWINGGNIDGTGSAFNVLKFEWVSESNVRIRVIQSLLAARRTSFLQAGVINAFARAEFVSSECCRSFASGAARDQLLSKLGNEFEAKKSKPGRHL
jgi:hypothetical protein